MVEGIKNSKRRPGRPPGSLNKKTVVRLEAIASAALPDRAMEAWYHSSIA
jgi:hypothetical protein